MAQVDFVVMEMDPNRDKSREPVMLLGRPFMATTRTTIDVYNRNISMTVPGKTMCFNAFNNTFSPVYSYEDHCLSINEINSSFDKNVKEQDKRSIYTALEEGLHTNVQAYGK